MDVVVYKAKGKNGYLYDMSFNPYVDFEILKNTRDVKGLEVLTPKIPIEDGEAILKKIYGKSILKRFVSTHDYFIRRGLKKLKIDEINNNITFGLKIPLAEEVALVENCIMGKVITINKLLDFKEKFKLTEEKIMNIIQLLYCERRIRIIPAVRKIKNKKTCSFCEKELCDDCCLGFKNDDILLYAADNYNLGVPRTIGFKRKKLSESLNKAYNGVTGFISSSKKSDAILWCVPGSFDYAVLAEACVNVLMTGGKILYITSFLHLFETKQELSALLEGANISIINKYDTDFKDVDIVICSYNDYPCFHKAFDFVIYDERMAFSDKPLNNMVSISKRAVKENGKLLNITCFPELKRGSSGGNDPEIITIPVTNNRAPIPEPLIVTSRLLRESLPQIILDTVKWSIEDNLKMIIFVPSEDWSLNIYNNIVNSLDVKRELIDFSNSKDKMALIKLRKKEIQILISSDHKDLSSIIEDLNVIVINADDSVYTRDILLHMSSMANFHIKKKCGQVIFAVEKESEDVTITKDRIRGINKIAWENGYLKK